MPAEELRIVSFLKDLSPEELQMFLTLLHVREVRKGERILTEGEPVHALSIVLRGTVHVRRKAGKREVMLGRIGVGGFFGEINLFEPGLATASIIAMDNVHIGSIGHETLRTFMANNTNAGYKICSALLAEVSRRLRTTNQRLVNAVFWASTDPTTAVRSKPED